MAARDIILHDFWLKSFSLVLAVMVWLAVHANIRTESSGAQNPFRPHEYRAPGDLPRHVGTRRRADQ